jgi:hypothetical protein
MAAMPCTCTHATELQEPQRCSPHTGSVLNHMSIQSRHPHERAATHGTLRPLLPPLPLLQHVLCMALRHRALPLLQACCCLLPALQ